MAGSLPAPLCRALDVWNASRQITALAGSPPPHARSLANRFRSLPDGPCEGGGRTGSASHRADSTCHRGRRTLQRGEGGDDRREVLHRGGQRGELGADLADVRHRILHIAGPVQDVVHEALGVVDHVADPPGERVVPSGHNRLLSQSAPAIPAESNITYRVTGATVTQRVSVCQAPGTVTACPAWCRAPGCSTTAPGGDGPRPPFSCSGFRPGSTRPGSRP